MGLTFDLPHLQSNSGEQVGKTWWDAVGKRLEVGRTRATSIGGLLPLGGLPGSLPPNLPASLPSHFTSVADKL